ncbi:hypothetical protein WDZ16_02725 [Pseudokineococcus marinus]|uniref:Polyketide cyclase / dehydrase and lipid transport n=1 Tax=Pseudokineococcus marinus TaxID=351215 RepID=A0A849BXZ9_9ACTN|nr:hypothetical protein [Pseudokineococcus marinus]NNH22398.1 hypothetical protein [Pseudokineococcus marinus]
MSGPRDTIASAVRGAVQGVAGKVGEVVGRRSSGAQQTLTVGRPVDDVAALWRDPAAVRQALGDAGTVEADGDRWTWRLARPGSDEPVEWRTTLEEGGPSTAFPGSSVVLRWSDPADASEAASELVVVLREAPQDLGTEQVVRLDLPVPDLAAGAMALTLGYRARALLMTGEVPTITPQPSGRSADR